MLFRTYVLPSNQLIALEKERILSLVWTMADQRVNACGCGSATRSGPLKPLLLSPFCLPCGAPNLHQSAAWCSAPPWRTGTPSALRCASGNPGAAPPTSSSWSPSAWSPVRAGTPPPACRRAETRSFVHFLFNVSPVQQRPTKYPIHHRFCDWGHSFSYFLLSLQCIVGTLFNSCASHPIDNNMFWIWSLLKTPNWNKSINLIFNYECFLSSIFNFPKQSINRLIDQNAAQAPQSVGNIS